MRKLLLALVCLAACKEEPPQLVTKNSELAPPPPVAPPPAPPSPEEEKWFADMESTNDDAVNKAMAGLLEECEQGRMSHGAAPRLVANFHKSAEWLRAHQGKTPGEWMWVDEYAGHREYAGYLLDIFKCLPRVLVEPELTAAMTFVDPKLVLFALQTELLLKLDVPDDPIERVAAFPEQRRWLYRKLDEAGMAKRFPAKYLTSQAFAEADMVGWLVYPTELGSAPAELQLGKVVHDDKAGDYYVFKYKAFASSPFAKDGWLAGVAGPYDPSEGPTAEAQGGTFSRFEKYDSKTPEKHVGEIAKQLEDNFEKVDTPPTTGPKKSLPLAHDD